MKKSYLVTGGAGFIGSNLARKIIAGGGKVYIIDDLSTGFERNIPDGAIFYKTDISRPDQVGKLKLPYKLDTVYHLAAQSSGEASFDDPVRDIEVNYTGTYNILKLAEKKGAKRFIYSSSMSVYGPASYYGCNKLASENMIRIYTKSTRIKSTILRFFSVYGPGQNMFNMKQGMVSIYLAYILNSRPITVKGSLDRFRDIIYIDDVVSILESCEDNPAAYGETFDVGTGMKTTVKDLLKAILKAYGKNNFDKWVKTAPGTPGDIKGCVADITKARRLLGWEHEHNLREGIAGMKEWLDRTKDLWVK